MLKKEILKLLDLVKAGLAEDPLIPIFTHFCFDGKYVVASNDKTTVMAPCDMPEAFAVNGKMLLNLLQASSNQQIDFEVTAENVLVKSGRTKMKLPYMKQEDFIFEEPEEELWTFILDIDDNLLNGLELAMVTTSTNSTMPAFMGVSVRGGDETCFYSCDGDALSKYQLSGVKTDPEQYIIPVTFCEALMKIIKHKAVGGTLYVNENWAVAELENDFKIYGKIIENPEDFDFEEQLKKTFKKQPEYVPVPENMEAVLKRAAIVAETEGKPTKLTIKDNKIHLHTSTFMGEVKDVLKLGQAHEDIEVSVSASLVNRAISVCDEFAVTSNCTIYRSGSSFLQVVANFEE